MLQKKYFMPLQLQNISSSWWQQQTLLLEVNAFVSSLGRYIILNRYIFFVENKINRYDVSNTLIFERIVLQLCKNCCETFNYKLRFEHSPVIFIATENFVR